ncbi:MULTISPECIES: hypothetical protein [unclassified Sphingobium]|nr:MULTISPECIES: hypothetical protein [Sphingomonadaceae]AMK25288.1 acetyl-CoA acetyltransferase [Sphingobium sp. TKS]NML87944.1 hypothetical protein [Sphingobium sp. TB-6]
MEPVIVGWGHAKFGKHDALSLEQLIRSAASEALASAGIGAGRRATPDGE